MAQTGNWNSLPMLPFNEKGERQIFSGENLTFVRNVLNPGFPAFTHSHPHEQIVYIASGQCEFMVGEEWIKMGPGSMLHVPPNVVHDVIVIGDEPVVNFDIFTPVREDFVEAFKQAEQDTNK